MSQRSRPAGRLPPRLLRDGRLPFPLARGCSLQARPCPTQRGRLSPATSRTGPRPVLRAQVSGALHRRAGVWGRVGPQHPVISGGFPLGPSVRPLCSRPPSGRPSLGARETGAARRPLNHRPEPAPGPSARPCRLSAPLPADSAAGIAPSAPAARGERGWGSGRRGPRARLCLDPRGLTPTAVMLRRAAGGLHTEPSPPPVTRSQRDAR